MSGPAGRPTSWTTGDLARLLGAELIGPADITLSGIDPIDTAGPNSLTFIRSRPYLDRWKASAAGGTLLSRALTKEPVFRSFDTSRRAILIVDGADRALSTLLTLIARPPTRPQGVSSNALIDPSARVAPDVRIGPFVTIGAGCEIGPGTTLHAGVTLGSEVSIGSACELHPRVVVMDRCVIGDRVFLHPGVVVGGDGFGYLPAPGGGGLVKIPHAGIVEIHDDVEIGANTCIDRGKLGSTIIGAGTKIDNLVQIAHNVRIGRSSIICGACAIGGSTVIGDAVTLAGKVGIADNLTIGDRAVVSAYSAVMRSIPAGQTWGGSPAQPFTAYMRGVAGLSRLPEMMRQLGRLTSDATPTSPEPPSEPSI